MLVGEPVRVAVCVVVGLPVRVGVCVCVPVAVGLPVRVVVGVAVGVPLVDVGVDVGGRGVGVDVFDGRAVGDGVAVGVGVRVDVGEGGPGVHGIAFVPEPRSP